MAVSIARMRPFGDRAWMMLSRHLHHTYHEYHVNHRSNAMANTNVAAMSSAMVLEPKGVRTLDVGSAMEQVVATLLKNGPGSSAAYGVLVYGTRDPKPQPNMLVAAQTFFHAYRKAWKVLSHIGDFTHSSVSREAVPLPMAIARTLCLAIRAARMSPAPDAAFLEVWR
jgi:hypothetical protein